MDTENRRFDGHSPIVSPMHCVRPSGSKSSSRVGRTTTGDRPLSSGS
ncbi:hypothetical protein NJ7G_0411 [Natrinema sp. J7-2]|nr:hypothetical protein NJ7G_0411 [Natrinema sp. J7-2]